MEKEEKANNAHTAPTQRKSTPKFRQNHDCTLQVSYVHRCQVSTYSTKHPEVSQCAKLQGFGLSKTTLQVSTYPIKPPKFHNTLKSKVSDYPKRPSQFLSTHEVREFLTIPPPTHPTKYPHHTPRSLLGSLIASKMPHLSRENFTPWGLDRPPPAPPRTGGNPSVCVPKNA